MKQNDREPTFPGEQGKAVCKAKITMDKHTPGSDNYHSTNNVAGSTPRFAFVTCQVVPPKDLKALLADLRRAWNEAESTGGPGCSVECITTITDADVVRHAGGMPSLIVLMNVVDGGLKGRTLHTEVPLSVRSMNSSRTLLERLGFANLDEVEPKPLIGKMARVIVTTHFSTLRSTEVLQVFGSERNTGSSGAD